MAKRILVIEDEHNVAAFIKQGLEEAGYLVDVAFESKQGMALLEEKPIDLIILDIILPGTDGRTFAKTVRALGYQQIPIILLTALEGVENVVNGLDAGADDYLTKPFKFKELLARIRALIRRKGNVSIVNPKLTAFDLELDRDTKTAIRSGREIKLTSTEFRLLEFLLKNKNRVLSRVDILESVWDINFNLGTNVVDVYINYLRNKIDKDFEPKLIHTLIGMGYTIKE